MSLDRWQVRSVVPSGLWKSGGQGSFFLIHLCPSLLGTGSQATVGLISCLLSAHTPGPRPTFAWTQRQRHGGLVISLPSPPLPTVQLSVGPMARDVESLALCLRALLCEDMFRLDPTVPPLPFNEEVSRRGGGRHGVGRLVMVLLALEQPPGSVGRPWRPHFLKTDLPPTLPTASVSCCSAEGHQVEPLPACGSPEASNASRSLC